MHNSIDPFIVWLAGFVDGEGYFAVHVNYRERKGRHSLTFTPTCNVTQHKARRRVLDDIVTHLGYGSVYVRTEAVGANYATTKQEDARKFATTLLPFLKIKRSQAEDVIRACDLLDKCPRDGVNMYAGERVLDVNTATELVEIAASMNESMNHGDRMNGRSRDEMMALIKQVYDQEALPSRRLEVACAQCGALHERYFSSIKSGQKMFCSKPCADKYSALVSSTRYKVDVTCFRCKTVFKRIKSDVKPSRNFCSTACSNKQTAEERCAERAKLEANPPANGDIESLLKEAYEEVLTPEGRALLSDK